MRVPYTTIFSFDSKGDSDAAVAAATAAVVRAIKEETEDKDRVVRSVIAEFPPLSAADAATTTAALHCDMQLQTNNAAALMSRLMPDVGEPNAWKTRLHRIRDIELQIATEAC